jgi:hypothetical protein
MVINEYNGYNGYNDRNLVYMNEHDSCNNCQTRGIRASFQYDYGYAVCKVCWVLDKDRWISDGIFSKNEEDSARLVDVSGIGDVLDSIRQPIDGVE